LEGWSQKDGVEGDKEVDVSRSGWRGGLRRMELNGIKSGGEKIRLEGWSQKDGVEGDKEVDVRRSGWRGGVRRTRLKGLEKWR